MISSTYEKCIIAYAPYDHFAASISDKEYSYLLSHKISDENLLPNLLLANFYVTNKEEQNITIYEPSDEPYELTVYLGDYCNLNCIYCFATPYRKGNFDKDKIKTGVKIMLEKYNKINVISFFGNGEPTLYFDLLEEIVNITKKIKSGNIKFHLTTNGVFGKDIDKKVKFLVDNNFSIQLSMDGPSYIQNIQRPLSKKGESLNYVINTINKFKEYGDINKYCYVRFTLSAFVSKNLIEVIKFFKGLGFKKIRFAELIKQGNANIRDNEFTNPPEPNKIVNDIVNILLLSEEMNIDLSGDYDIRRVTRSIFPCTNMSGLSATMNKDLELLSCLEDNKDYLIGKINVETSNVEIDKNKQLKFYKRNMFSLDNCVKCPVKCGGGCTHYSYIKNNSLNVSGEYQEKCDALRLILAKYLYTKLGEANVNIER